MTRKFICLQGSPEIPKGSEVRKNGDMYDLYIGGIKYVTKMGTPVYMYPWQIEGNDCWEEVKEEPAGRWVPESQNLYYSVLANGSVSREKWNDGSDDDARYQIGNVYRTEQEAQDEVKRRESIAKAWWPEFGEPCWMWRSYSGVLKIDEYIDAFTADCYIGACHKTKEACEQWGKEYGHLFDKRSEHD